MKDDVEMACTIIRKSREDAKRYSKKGITIRIGSDVENRIISTVLLVGVDPITSNTTLTHAIKYRNVNIYPTTRQGKMVCGDAASIERLYRVRAQSLKRTNERNRKMRKTNVEGV